MDNFKFINNNLKEVIDLGKNNLSNEAIDYLLKRNTFCQRLDIGNEIIREIDSQIRILNRKQIVPKRVIKQTKLCLRGYLGKQGER